MRLITFFAISAGTAVSRRLGLQPDIGGKSGMMLTMSLLRVLCSVIAGVLLSLVLCEALLAGLRLLAGNERIAPGLQAGDTVSPAIAISMLMIWLVSAGLGAILAGALAWHWTGALPVDQPRRLPWQPVAAAWCSALWWIPVVFVVGRLGGLATTAQWSGGGLCVLAAVLATLVLRTLARPEDATA